MNFTMQILNHLLVLFTVLTAVCCSHDSYHDTISLLNPRTRGSPPNPNVLRLSPELSLRPTSQLLPHSPPGAPTDPDPHKRRSEPTARSSPQHRRPRKVAIRWFRILGENAPGQVQYQLAVTTWDSAVHRLPPEPNAESFTRLLPEPHRPRNGPGSGSSDDRAWAAWRLPPRLTGWWRLSAPVGLPVPRVSRRPLGVPAPAGKRYLLDLQIYEILFHLPMAGKLVLSDGERGRLETYLHAVRLPAEPCPPRVRQQWRKLYVRADPTRPVPVEGPVRRPNRAGEPGTERPSDSDTSAKESGAEELKGEAVSRSTNSKSQ